MLIGDIGELSSIFSQLNKVNESNITKLIFLKNLIIEEKIFL